METMRNNLPKASSVSNPDSMRNNESPNFPASYNGTYSCNDTDRQHFKRICDCKSSSYLASQRSENP